MPALLKVLLLIIVLAPLLGAVITGLFCRRISRRMAHSLTIGLMLMSFGCALIAGYDYLSQAYPPYETVFYHWVTSGSFQFDVGFLVDHLTALMMVTVTFVSLLVHIYTIGYMSDDPGYQRFFSYMSAFTFAMLILVAANNFALLFFGWEGVGLISYLLIGFWFHKE